MHIEHKHADQWRAICPRCRRCINNGNQPKVRCGNCNARLVAEYDGVLEPKLHGLVCGNRCAEWCCLTCPSCEATIYEATIEFKAKVFRWTEGLLGVALLNVAFDATVFFFNQDQYTSFGDFITITICPMAFLSGVTAFWFVPIISSLLNFFWPKYGWFRGKRGLIEIE